MNELALYLAGIPVAVVAFSEDSGDAARNWEHLTIKAAIWPIFGVWLFFLYLLRRFENGGRGY